MRSVLSRVSAKVEPGGNSAESTTRDWSSCGINPDGSMPVAQIDAENNPTPATSVKYRTLNVARRNRV